MKLLYKNKKIEKLCTDEKKSIKELGTDVSNRLLKTINLLKSATNLKDILVFPQYKLHKLIGDKDEIYSIYLGKTTGYRLLLIPLYENEIPIKSNDMSIYTMTVCIEIIEVSKHYE